MFQPNEETMATLKKLNANYRIVHIGPTHIEVNGKQVLDPERPPTIRAEILDMTLGGTPYCWADGATEQEAVKNAVLKAKTAPKPLTPAQATDDRFVRMASLESENAALKAKLAAQTQTNQTVLVPEVRGRKPYTPEQKEAARQRMANARAARTNKQEA